MFDGLVPGRGIGLYWAWRIAGDRFRVGIAARTSRSNRVNRETELTP